MFKSFMCFIVAICFLLITSAYIKPKFSNYASDITLYAYGYSSNAKRVNENILHTGESFTLSKGQIDVEKFLQDYSAEILFVEETQEGTSYYAYTKKLNTEKIIKGQKINLHIFIGKSTISVGTPIIYGSF